MTDEATSGVEAVLPMSAAPKNATWVHLLIDYSTHDATCQMEDDSGPQWTIGFNNDDNTGENKGWKFVGWDWQHDCIVGTSAGTPIGWLPFPTLATPAASPATALASSEAARLRQERINEISRSNIEDGWCALRMIREAVETLGPVGSIPSQEHVACAIAPTPAAEAEAIIAGIQKIEARASVAIRLAEGALDPLDLKNDDPNYTQGLKDGIALAVSAIRNNGGEGEASHG